MQIRRFPKTARSLTKIGEAVLQDLTRVAELDGKCASGPFGYGIPMAPSFLCSRIQYHFVTKKFEGCYPLGNASIFTGITIEDVLSTLQEKSFDEMAASLLECVYMLSFSGLRFIVYEETRS
jgi:hypothetical protein